MWDKGRKFSGVPCMITRETKLFWVENFTGLIAYTSQNISSPQAHP
jgi:hypothetical protein